MPLFNLAINSLNISVFLLTPLASLRNKGKVNNDPGAQGVGVLTEHNETGALRRVCVTMR
jgi:hypothetical protein